MKFFYLTAKQYPGKTADHNYIKNLAKSFFAILGKNFNLVVCNTADTAFEDVSIINLKIPPYLKRTIFFFFWIPYLLIRNTYADHHKDKIIFFSNDQNLLSVLIFWRFILNKKITIVADWHLLTDTWKDKFVAKNVDMSISTSKKLKLAMKNLAPCSRVHVVYGGVRLEDFKIDKDRLGLRRELGLPTDKILVGYVGLFRTLGQEKGILTMIDSIKYLDPKYCLVFVGGKSDEIIYYTNYANERGYTDRCIFLPIQSFDMVVKYEKAMDILSIPYPDKPHFRKYGFPMKIYEYLASGVPIIYTRLDLAEEILADCAFGISPDDPFQFAKAANKIIDEPKLASTLVQRGMDVVSKLDWQSKANAILQVSDIISPMLNISNKALKYILFQRTEFSIYQSYPKLLRLVMNKKFHIYNLAIKIESILLKSRTKRLFSLDMEREYSIIKDHLIPKVQKILDIGCGVAGIDIMLNKYYVSNNQHPSIYLLDKSEINSKVYYGIEKEAAYYNSLNIARELLIDNGVESNRIFLQEVDGRPIYPNDKFDLILSLISWGFHYPISTYLDQVYERLNVGGQLIVDVRKGTDGFELLKNKFGSYEVIYEARKHQRLSIIKR